MQLGEIAFAIIMLVIMVALTSLDKPKRKKPIKTNINVHKIDTPQWKVNNVDVVGSCPECDAYNRRRGYDRPHHTPHTD